MEWVRSFYAQQHQWLAAYYQAPLGDEHHARAALVPALASPPPGRVLELGAGGGQVAAATAALGYDVTAVDLTLVATAHARSLVSAVAPGHLTVLEGDFYTLDISGDFAVVTYWDGFGIGTDADQRRLLRRIRDWLAPTGTALIEVSTPWYWAAAAGTEREIGAMRRRYAFDADGGRLLDHCWSSTAPEAIKTQTLRCYGPADLRLVLEGTGLELASVRPGGGPDPTSGEWRAQVPLTAAMSYVAVLTPTRE